MQLNDGKATNVSKLKKICTLNILVNKTVKKPKLIKIYDFLLINNEVLYRPTCSLQQKFYFYINIEFFCESNPIEWFFITLVNLTA